MTPAPKSGFLADLFCGPGNFAWEFGRILTAVVQLPVFAALGWNFHLGGAVSVQEVALGEAGLVGACAILIAAKDWARTNAISQAVQDKTADTSQEKRDETAATKVEAEALVPEAKAAAIDAAVEKKAKDNE